ncbi:hypothetical protein GE061_002009 [Apolygus lucorum]|uniref:Uncharacterized protein n=1 Tax=Apolygus lucorum TaxID=248454 RepID=A0A8S9X6H3_APOLU|nr:hypothetical protein GE061_002009 [Apolygus lucorum]
MEVPVVEPGMDVPTIGPGTEVPRLVPHMEVPMVEQGMDVPIIGPGTEVSKLVPHMEVPVVEPSMDVPIDGLGGKTPDLAPRPEVPAVDSRADTKATDEIPEDDINSEIEGMVDSVGYPVARLPLGDIEFWRIGAVLSDDPMDAGEGAEELPIKQWDHERSDTRTELGVRLQHLDEEQWGRVEEILHEFREVFSKPDPEGCHLDAEHVIDTKQADRINRRRNTRQYREGDRVKKQKSDETMQAKLVLIEPPLRVDVNTL